MPKPAEIAHTTEEKSTKKPAIICKICGIKMKSYSALGGHMSNTHPKMSSKFSKRMRIREERTFERSMLQAAKDVFLTLSPDGNINESRNRVCYLKLKIRNLVGDEKTADKIKESAEILLAKCGRSRNFDKN